MELKILFKMAIILQLQIISALNSNASELQASYFNCTFLGIFFIVVGMFRDPFGLPEWYHVLYISTSVWVLHTPNTG